VGPLAAQARPLDVKVVVVAAVRALILTKGSVRETQALSGAQPRGVVQPAVAVQSSLVALEPLHNRHRAEVELEAAASFAQLVATIYHRFS
jgi:hypothetical protein